jgi:hypothetical protein
VEHHLRVEKARDSLQSYSTVVLGPHVCFPLRRALWATDIHRVH